MLFHQCFHKTQLQRTAVKITMIKYIFIFIYIRVYLLCFVFFFFLIPATRSCHNCLLRHGWGAGGPGRDVLQQLLPLPALAGGTRRSDGRGPVGAEREADPRTNWQAVQITGSSWKDQNTRVCTRSKTANTGTCPILSSRGFPYTSDTD